MNNYRMKSTFFIMFIMIGSVTFLNTIFEGKINLTKRLIIQIKTKDNKI